VDPDGLDALVDRFEHNVGPRNGARVVAQAVKIDPLETEAYVGLAQGLGYAGIFGFCPSAFGRLIAGSSRRLVHRDDLECATSTLSCARQQAIFGCGKAALWGRLAACRRLSIGAPGRSINNRPQDSILPHYL
jgi:hypothetical protein